MMSSVNPDWLLFLVRSFGGDDAIERALPDPESFVNSSFAQRIHGHLFLQEWKASPTSPMSPEDVVLCRSLYFENQFDIVEAHEGTVSQIVGDLFMCYWSHQNVDIGALVDDMSDGVDRVRRQLTEMKANFSIEGIRSYIDVGDFFLTKNGSRKRFTLTPLGLFVNDCLTTANKLWTAPSTRWFLGGSVSGGRYSGRLRKFLDTSRGPVNELVGLA